MAKRRRKRNGVRELTAAQMREALTVQDVAEALDVTPARVRQLVEEYDLPLEPCWTERGPKRLVLREDFDEWKETVNAHRRRWYMRGDG